MIKFYNSLTKKKEEFIPIEKNKVKIYSCGPTVYDFVHIGNLRAFLFADILVRTLKYFKFEVKNVMNITDVDDKTIKNSQIVSKKNSLKSKEFKIENESPNQILKKFTEKYTNYFLEDLKTINIEKPQIMPNATSSIKDMEFLIEKLVQKEFAYISEDGIYFDIKKAKNYGRLVNIDFKAQKYNKDNRVVNDEYDKDNSQDFALWKFKKNEDEPSWTIKINISKKNSLKTEYIGRPGWHIECSAMAMKYLGQKFDIHTGGVDLKFPHHENELCQSSCALDIDSQANYWMHNEHLLVNNKKMSKSLGNFYTLRDLLEKGYSPIAIREVFLRANYRQQLNFTFKSLDAAQTNIKKINDFYQKINEIKINKKDEKLNIQSIYSKYIKLFEKGLKDDLNTPNAISAIYEFMTEINKIELFSKKDTELIKEFIDKTNQVFALLKKEENIPEEIVALAKKRLTAKENKDWGTSDKIREEIKRKGFEIKDDKNSKTGYLISKI